MVPTLKLGKENLLGNGFINGYSKDLQKEVDYKDAIYLVFKPVSEKRFKIFLNNEYDKNEGIVEDYDYPGGFVVVVYKLNKDFDSDFRLVRQGKYSKTSKSFQDMFPREIELTGGKREISLQYRIFNKSDKLKEHWEKKLGVTLDVSDEVWTGFFEEYETLNYLELSLKDNQPSYSK